MHRLVVVCSLAALPAMAQYVPMDFSSQTYNSMNISAGSLLSTTTLAMTQRRARRSETPTTTVGDGDVAHELARSYPVGDRVNAEQHFARLLRDFALIEKQVGLEPGDVAGAMACLIVGSYEGYRDVTVDPRHYQPVIRQLRSALSSDTRFATLSGTERRALYERMAILGMYVIHARVSLSRPADPAALRALRQTSAGSLSYLQLDPASLRIGSSGLSLAN